LDRYAAGFAAADFSDVLLLSDAGLDSLLDDSLEDLDESLDDFDESLDDAAAVSPLVFALSDESVDVLFLA
jgi:hypothetical protein